MTTEENVQPREIATLLALDTYQDMTDDEIELVIGWKVDDAVQRALASEELADKKAATEEMVSITRQNADNLASMVQAIAAYVPELEVISNE